MVNALHFFPALFARRFDTFSYVSIEWNRLSNRNKRGHCYGETRLIKRVSSNGVCLLNSVYIKALQSHH